MYGAVFGDVIGSCYERRCTKDYNFELFTSESAFTDDTVLMAAVCDAILYNPAPAKPLDGRAYEYAVRYRQYYGRFPHAGFGKMFSDWAEGDGMPRQKSYGNGAAMRVVPIGYAYGDMGEVLKQARLSAVYTHNHPEAIRGAQAVAAAVFMARRGCPKEEIKAFLQNKFGYGLGMTVEEIRAEYGFDSRTANSVPQAICCFLESVSYEDAVRKAVSLGGDADTLACIAGGLAETFGYGIPDFIRGKCMSLLDGGLKRTFAEFHAKYCLS